MTTVKKLLANLFGHQGGRPGASSNDRSPSTSVQAPPSADGNREQEATPTPPPPAASGQQHATPVPVAKAQDHVLGPEGLPAVAQTALGPISGPWNNNPFNVEGMVIVVTGGGTGKCMV